MNDVVQEPLYFISLKHVDNMKEYYIIIGNYFMCLC
jgi:hypothetical protein